MNQQVPAVQAIKVDPRTTQHHPQGQVYHLTCSNAPGCSDGTAGGSRQDPNEPRHEVAHLTMSLLMTHIRSYPLRMVFTVPAIPREISKDSMKVTFYHQR